MLVDDFLLSIADLSSDAPPDGERGAFAEPGITSISENSDADHSQPIRPEVDQHEPYYHQRQHLPQNAQFHQHHLQKNQLNQPISCSEPALRDNSESSNQTSVFLDGSDISKHSCAEADLPAIQQNYLQQPHKQPQQTHHHQPTQQQHSHLLQHHEQSQPIQSQCHGQHTGNVAFQPKADQPVLHASPLHSGQLSLDGTLETGRQSWQSNLPLSGSHQMVII
ncbi:unnamed protein product [Protopolystoma xenopodis]|uniref:Uncharacterized protein n=1 Tax=Protopolystoma xenopodis TaxID=117903 RepID=A0A448XEN7_9PLAT|nr:unnamed protein product [Protopolystoma xenopodis]